MGSWNGTCMISNLPINSGDEIKLVLIRKNSGFNRLNLSGGYIYTTDIFTPSFLPISGKYNDYGMIEEIIEDWNYVLIEGLLKDMYGKEIVVDGEKMSDWNLYDVLDGIERNNLLYNGIDEEEIFRVEIAKQALEVYKDNEDIPASTIKEYEDIASINIDKGLKTPNASFVMIRADIWDHIINNYKGEFYNTQSEDYGTISAKQWCRQEFDTAIKKNNTYELFARGMCGNLLKPQVHAKLVKKGKKIREEIFKQWSEFIIISSYLNGIRTGWMPQSGAGSQSESWSEYKLLAEKIVEISDEMIKEYEEFE
tara:strand:- start:6136 stop:7065 length:930 start_codon:yes stop_codon:yes gene_type:complete